MRNFVSTVLITTSVLLLGSNSAHAEIYKWVDENGKAHFTDKPPTGKKTEEIELKINTYSAVEITPLVKRLGRPDKVVMSPLPGAASANRQKSISVKIISLTSPTISKKVVPGKETTKHYAARAYR